MPTLKIGVVGYSPPTKFDEQEARRLLGELLDQAAQGASPDDVMLVSGLTDVGVPGIAYHLAHERGWRTTGVACIKAFDHPLFPVDETIIVGDNWGDESQTFLAMCDVLVRVGGGKQSHAEVTTFRERGGIVYESDLDTLPTS